MTFKEFQTIIKNNNIPDNVHLTSDCEWECDATEMDGVFYNEEKNEIVFTQGEFDSNYEEDEKWKKLSGGNEDKNEGQ